MPYTSKRCRDITFFRYNAIDAYMIKFDNYCENLIPDSLCIFGCMKIFDVKATINQPMPYFMQFDYTGTDISTSQTSHD